MSLAGSTPQTEQMYVSVYRRDKPELCECGTEAPDDDSSVKKLKSNIPNRRMPDIGDKQKARDRYKAHKILAKALT